MPSEQQHASSLCEPPVQPAVPPQGERANTPHPPLPLAEPAPQPTSEPDDTSRRVDDSGNMPRNLVEDAHHHCTANDQDAERTAKSPSQQQESPDWSEEKQRLAEIITHLDGETFEFELAHAVAARINEFSVHERSYVTSWCDHQRATVAAAKSESDPHGESVTLHGRKNSSGAVSENTSHGETGSVPSTQTGQRSLPFDNSLQVFVGQLPCYVSGAFLADAVRFITGEPDIVTDCVVHTGRGRADVRCAFITLRDLAARKLVTEFNRHVFFTQHCMFIGRAVHHRHDSPLTILVAQLHRRTRARDLDACPRSTIVFGMPRRNAQGTNAYDAGNYSARHHSMHPDGGNVSSSGSIETIGGIRPGTSSEDPNSVNNNNGSPALHAIRHAISLPQHAGANALPAQQQSAFQAPQFAQAPHQQHALHAQQPLFPAQPSMPNLSGAQSITTASMLSSTAGPQFHHHHHQYIPQAAPLPTAMPGHFTTLAPQVYQNTSGRIADPQQTSGGSPVPSAAYGWAVGAPGTGPAAYPIMLHAAALPPHQAPPPHPPPHQFYSFPPGTQFLSHAVPHQTQ